MQQCFRAAIPEFMLDARNNSEHEILYFTLRVKRKLPLGKARHTLPYFACKSVYIKFLGLDQLAVS